MPRPVYPLCIPRASLNGCDNGLHNGRTVRNVGFRAAIDAKLPSTSWTGKVRLRPPKQVVL
jgi:hypothetical protein